MHPNEELGGEKKKNKLVSLSKAFKSGCHLHEYACKLARIYALAKHLDKFQIFKQA